MEPIYAQMTDETMTVMQGWFGNPQDPEVWKNQETVYPNDARYHEWYNRQVPGVRPYSPDPVFPAVNPHEED